MNLSYIKSRLAYWIQEKNIQNIRNELSQEDKVLIHKKANELNQNIFVFDKPWDMERCIIPFQLDELNWNIQLNDDEEWCFMLNRMDYLNYLILSENITHHLKAKEMILSWIQQHPTIQPEPSTRTLDTGIRMMNIFESLPYLYDEGLLSDQEIITICSSLLDQAKYLKDHYLLKYITSNWGSIQTSALLCVLPNIEEDNEVYDWAYEEWHRQIKAQVYPDGMHWEQSTMYHIEVLNYCMKTLFYNRNVGHKDIVYSLAKSILLQATPAKEIETFGDSDRSNIQDVMTRASILFNDGEFKYYAFDQMDLESLYTFGANTNFKDIEPKVPSTTNYDANFAGMYVTRSDWSTTANFTMFTNGTLGSGHGHSDNNHISIYYQGKPVTIDPGRFTYREDHPYRVYLKSMKAHNNVIVDNQESCMPSDSWGYADFGVPLKNYVYHEKGMHYYEGTLISHSPLQVWTRKVVVLDYGIWMIVDEVKEDGKHQAITRFHMDPEYDRDNVQIVSDVKPEIIEDICSLRYNEELKSEVYTYTRNFEDTLNTCTSVCDRQVKVEDINVYQEKNVLSDDIVCAKKYIISENESYSIAVFHKEIFKGKKILFLEGEPFHNKVFVVHEHNGQKESFVLRG